MNVNSVKFNEVLKKFETLTCPYSGKKLSPEETKKMIEHLTIKPKKGYEHKFTLQEEFDMKNWLNKLNEIIAKNPKDVELRKYRALVEKFGEIKK